MYVFIFPLFQFKKSVTESLYSARNARPFITSPCIFITTLRYFHYIGIPLYMSMPVFFSFCFLIRLFRTSAITDLATFYSGKVYDK